MVKSFLLGLWATLHERVWLSYRSTILGVLVAVLGEALNYFYLSVPDPRVHAVVALLTTVFVAWKDRKVKEGSIKLLSIGILLFSFGAWAQHPQARAVQAHALADAIEQDPNAVPPDAPLPTPEPQFGGCVKAGKLCFGPSAAIMVAAINLRTNKIEGAFTPGVGYGITLNPGKWSSLGADLYLTVDPAAQQGSVAVLLKFINGYFRIGASKGFIGDTAWRIPLALGIPLP